jgi:hypothetical protein
VNIAVAIISALISASSFWVAVQRYRREVARKQLTYFSRSKIRQAAITIYVWNSGNILIEPEDYISPLGFNFGEGTQVQDVKVEYQVPEDLDIAVKVVDSQKLEIIPTLLNPEDEFAVRVLLRFPEKPQQARRLTRRVDPKPYGRIRGTHIALRKRKRNLNLPLITGIVFAILTIISWALTN